MDASIAVEATAETSEQGTKEYKSRPGALIWFFRRSRDLWKDKYQGLKASFKRLTNRVADLTKSRDLWKEKAKRAEGQVAALEAQIVSLQAEVAALTSEKKKSRASAG
jgi:chromosome segregation ATPase